MFRIKAGYSDQLEVKTTADRARQFFSEIQNFVDLMPGIESIRREADGILRWIVSAEVPMYGTVRAAFTVEQTESGPERIEWSPASSENENYLRYAADFEERGASTMVKIAQHVELRRPHARDFHSLASLIGEGPISAELQKHVVKMIKTFLERSRSKLESEMMSEPPAVAGRPL